MDPTTIHLEMVFKPASKIRAMNKVSGWLLRGCLGMGFSLKQDPEAKQEPCPDKEYTHHAEAEEVSLLPLCKAPPCLL